MANQVSIDTVPVMIRISNEDAAKLFTVARTRSQKQGRNVSKSECLKKLVHAWLEKVVPTDEAKTWAAGRRMKAAAVRAKADKDVRSGKYRKPGWEEADRKKAERKLKLAA